MEDRKVRTMENKGQETREKLIAEYVRSHVQETLALLKELAVIPAPLEREEKRAAFVQNWLHGIGARKAYTDAAGNVIFPCSCDVDGVQAASQPGADNMRAASSPEADASRTVSRPDVCDADGWTVVTAHMDVVCPDTDALPLEETEERLVGPGVRDDTANLVNMLMAVKFLLIHPEQRKSRILFVADVGEEGLGNLRGSREILRNFDGQIRRWISFDLNYDTIYTRAVGARRYRITVSTEGGHSYSDFGEANAIHKMAELIAELYQIKVSDFPAKATYNVGVIEGGTSVNTIAQEASMLFELRSESETVLSGLQEILYEKIERHRTENVRIRTELIGVRPGNGAVDPQRQEELEQQCMRAIRRYYGGKVTAAAGSTDCNIPLAAGIPAVTVGTAYGAGTHTRQEWVSKESMQIGQAIALEILLGL